MAKKGRTSPTLRFPGFTKPWEQRKLAEILTERHILTTITDEYPRLSFTIEDGVISPEDRKTNKRDFLMKDEMSKKFLVTEVGDIIYNPANVIYGALHKNDYAKGCLSPIYRIFYSDYDTTYLECILRADSFIQTLSQKTEGTVVKLKTLKPEAFLGMKIYVTSSVKEQKKIAEYFNNLDRLITLHQHKCDALRRLKAAMLQKMFPRKGATEPELRFPGFTGPWEQRKLGDALLVLKDGTHGTHADAKEGPLLLSAKNIKAGSIKWDDTDRRISQEEYDKIHSKFSLMKGDVLLTIVGSIGETAILQDSDGITFQRSVAFLRPNNEIVSEFLYTEIQSPAFQKELDNRRSTSAQPGIYLGDLAEIPVKYSSFIEEQTKIGEYFSNLDHLITLHQRKCDALKKLKQAMLQQMFI